LLGPAYWFLPAKRNSAWRMRWDKRLSCWMWVNRQREQAVTLSRCHECSVPRVPSVEALCRPVTTAQSSLDGHQLDLAIVELIGGETPVLLVRPY